jgi:formylglycine-generating enzyme required for sulfatase activity
MTTLVMRYSEGVSPYGIYDMAGNVWEWCRNAEGELDTTDITTNDKRAVKGGSYVSYYERSKIAFNYYLKPETLYGSIGFRLIAG